MIESFKNTGDLLHMNISAEFHVDLYMTFQTRLRSIYLVIIKSLRNAWILVYKPYKDVLDINISDKYDDLSVTVATFQTRSRWTILLAQ